MHGVDPACVSACPLGALQKTKEGPVIYDPEICFGCRYCMAACPFGIPKYEWDKVLTPGEYKTNYFEGFGQTALSHAWLAFITFYNKAIFEEVGVTPPKTMDEYWEMSEKIKRAGYEVMAAAGKGGWPLMLLHNQIIGRFLPTD